MDFCGYMCNLEQEVAMPLLTEERYNAILELLYRQEAVRVNDLSSRFDVSIETIRRDLKYLEEQNLLKRVHGGAVPADKSLETTHREERQVIHWEEKLELGETACRLVKEGQVVTMDASTTNHAAAIALGQQFRCLTVITNYLPIINELSQKPGFTLLIPGGVLRHGEMSIVGPMAEENMDAFHADVGFISISGISFSGGLTDYGLGEIAVKKKIIKNSDVNYVLADSSKFERNSLVKIGSLNEVNGIVTDSKLSKETEEKYQKAGISIIRKNNQPI